ncbi:MAG: CoA transferase [Dehalococcoidia bacterium]
MTARPLEGLIVADFCWVAAGPVGTRFLADAGATVIRIESSMRPDGLRMRGPYKDGIAGQNRSGFYNNFNAGKFSIALNMTTERGRTLARELVRQADIVANNYTPGTMGRWGLDYDSVKAINPGAIYISMPMMASSGPRRDFRGLGASIQAITGINWLTGHPEKPPQGPGFNFPDYMNPYYGVFAILSALHHRERTGEGQEIELSQYQATVSLTGEALLDAEVNGHVQDRQGNLDPEMAPHNIYPCAGDDRWIAIAVRDDQDWRAFCDATTGEPWASDTRFEGVAGRLKHRADLDAAIAEWTRPQDAHALMARLQEAGVPAGAVQDGRDVLDDPQITARGHYVALDHPEIGPLRHDTQSFRLSGSDIRPARPAPLLGEHTEWVCEHFLGLDRAQMDELYGEGVLT